MKIEVDNKEIKFINVDSRGKVINTGEEIDSFIGATFDLERLEVGKYPILTFNSKVNTKLAYKVIKIEKVGRNI